jgi:hypothetical protein
LVVVLDSLAHLVLASPLGQGTTIMLERCGPKNEDSKAAIVELYVSVLKCKPDIQMIQMRISETHTYPSTGFEIISWAP